MFLTYPPAYLRARIQIDEEYLILSLHCCNHGNCLLFNVLICFAFVFSTTKEELFSIYMQIIANENEQNLYLILTTKIMIKIHKTSF